MTEREFIPESTREAFIEALTSSEDFAPDMEPATRHTRARELVHGFFRKCSDYRTVPGELVE